MTFATTVDPITVAGSTYLPGVREDEPLTGAGERVIDDVGSSGVDVAHPPFVATAEEIVWADAELWVVAIRLTNHGVRVAHAFADHELTSTADSGAQQVGTPRGTEVAELQISTGHAVIDLGPDIVLGAADGPS